MLIPFAPPPGLVSDDTSFASPGRYADSSLVRWYENSWQVQGGFESLTTDLLTGVCRAVFPWTDADGVLNVGFGTHLALQVWQGGMLYDITPAAFVAGAIDGTGGAGYGTGTYGTGTYGSPSTADYWPLTWSLSSYGGTMIANPRGQGIFQWNNVTATPAIPLTNAPAVCTYALSLPQRQVMAFGCNEEISGTFNHLCIRWSDIENPTDWTTSPTNNAGEYILEGGGRIVAARVVGDYVFVWTDVNVYLGTYIGDPGETWRFDKQGAGGLIGPGAAVVVGQSVAWISPDAQFYSCPLGGQLSIIECPIRKAFADNIAIGQADKIVGASIAQFREIRWYYPDARDGFENSRAVTIGVGGNWYRDQLARTAFIDAGPSVSPIGVSYAGNAYWHEKGNSADGAVLSWFIESTDFYLDEAAANLTVNGVFPNFKDQVGGIRLSLIMREHPQATERTKGPYVLAPNLGRKSFRASGRVCRVRMEGSSSPAYARMGKLEFDVEAIGGR
jgi:hypothetical protein